MQVLKNDNNDLYPPLVLQSTKFLPSLSGVSWDNDELFSPDQKIVFKREKLNFTIIKETGDNDVSKYEMFQRLNTGGTHLSAQEIRNCLLIMINKSLYELINDLHNDDNFKGCIPLSDAKSEERYDLALIVRYLLYTSFSDEFLNNVDKSRNMDIFLTEELEKYALIKNNPYIDVSNEIFSRIFRLLNEILGENFFRRFQGDTFSGPFMLSAFEAIIPGLFVNINYWESNKENLKNKIVEIYSQDEFINASKKGTRALDRMCQLVTFSKMWFRA